MLKFNTTLKHVEVVPVSWIKCWIIGEGHRHWKGPRDVVLGQSITLSDFTMTTGHAMKE
jgi:hypothetical protein